jgi:hypothetical protein
MVKGLDLFRAHFQDFAGQYMIIGGTACSVLMEHVNLTFRATKDLDIVLCAEALTDDFFRAFWNFITAGGYEIRQKSDGQPQLYRFSKPADRRYPAMLEIFSRRPDVAIAEDSQLTPIPTDDEVYSLSAILLDDAYYDFIRGGAMIIDGITVVEANHLIPLKVKAFLDLRARRMAGEAIDSKVIQKHKNDVFRLLLVAQNTVLSLPSGMQQDVLQFIEILREERVNLKDLGITRITMDEALENLATMYS